MNVLHINSNYLTSILHENLMEQLESQKIKNTIFMPMKEEKQEEIKYDTKFNLFNPIAFKNRDRYFFIWKQAKIYRQLKKNVKPTDFQLSHAHTLFTDGNISYRLKKEYGIPYVVTVRGYTDIASFFKVRINLRPRGRNILREAAHIIFLSVEHRDELLEKYIPNQELRTHIEKHSSIIPNGIDSFWFEKQVEKTKVLGKSTLNLISVGQIMKRKNQKGTIEAAKYFEKTYNVPVNLTLVGKIVDQTYADELLEESTLSLTHIDHVSKEELIEYYRKNDIFVLPSIRETFGLVYPEAMSQGLPVIYTKGEGFYRQFEEGLVGYGVEANDPQDIAEKINSIYQDFERFSTNALKEYQKFNWTQLSEEIVSIYENV